MKPRERSVLFLSATAHQYFYNKYIICTSELIKAINTIKINMRINQQIIKNSSIKNKNNEQIIN